MKRLKQWADQFLFSTIRDIRQDQQEALQSPETMRSAVGVLACAGILLVFREEQYRPAFPDVVDFFLPADASDGGLQARWRRTITDSRNWELARLCYWSGWQSISYVLVPVLFVKLVLRHKLSDYGVKLATASRCWWAYLGMYLIILPFVLWMAQRDSFQATYPFLQPTDVTGELDQAYWNRFWIWQGFYAFQFLSLEFFFRGFMLHGTRRALGMGSIYVMMIPYCMIHFGKPLPETLGALIAGLVLGFMSLKTRSIWLGFLSHVSVALTMDYSALAVWRQSVG